MNFHNSYSNVPFVDWDQNAPKVDPDEAPIEQVQDEGEDYDFDDEDMERRYARGSVARYRDEDTPYGLDASDF